MRQGTPAQYITQPSPQVGMVAATPQMMHAGMMQGIQGPMPNGVPRQLNPQQLAELHRRQVLAQQQATQQSAMQQQMINGTPQMSPAQVAHLQAQHHAQADRQAAMQRQAAQQQQQHPMQQGTPQSQHMSPNPNQGQKAYNQSVAEHVKAQMQNLQQGQSHGSPASNHMTPNPQTAQLTQAQQQQMMLRAAHAAQAQAQAQSQGQMMGGGTPQPQQRAAMNPQLQQYYQNALTAYQQRFMTQAAAKYGGNVAMLQPADMQAINQQAKTSAQAAVHKKRQEMNMNQMQFQQAQMRQQ